MKRTIKDYQAKRILSIIMMVLLLSAYPARAEEIPVPEVLKVGLKFGDSAVTACSLTSDNGFLLGTVVDYSFLGSENLGGYRTVNASVTNGQILLTDESGNLIKTLDSNSTWCLMPTDHNTGGLVSLQAQELRVYRGGMILTCNGSGLMNILNLISMDEYLYGVLHAEMGQANPLEALKAQAVAARSFAIVNRGKHQADSFDICGTTHCQVYRGANIEYPNTIKAVDETSGIMIYSEGKSVAAYYYKNSGGLIRNSLDVWAFPSSYLKNKVDAYSPEYKWTVSLTAGEIQTKLAAAGYLVGEVKRITIQERATGGNVLTLLIEGSSGSAVLKKEAIRTILGSTIIKSLIFELNNGAQPLTITNGIESTQLDSAHYILHADGSKTKIDLTGLYGNDGNLIAPLGANNSVEGSSFIFSGKGYGHGLGMAQDSAIVMANQGILYDDILRYFYEGIEVR